MCSALIQSRYDILIKDAFFDVVDDPAEVYGALSKHVKSKLSPVNMEDAVWLKDPKELRRELIESANIKCHLTEAQLEALDLGDWQHALSDTEKSNYKQYLSDLKMAESKSERPLRAVCVGQNPEKRFMAGSETCFPAFTKSSTRRVMLTSHDRWLSAQEKMALYGWPVHHAP